MYNLSASKYYKASSSGLKENGSYKKRQGPPFPFPLSLRRGPGEFPLLPFPLLLSCPPQVFYAG